MKCMVYQELVINMARERNNAEETAYVPDCTGGIGKTYSWSVLYLLEVVSG